MKSHGCRLLWFTGATFLAAAISSQVAAEQERQLLVGKQQFEAKVLRVEPGRLEFQLPEPKERRVLNLSPELLAKLRLVPNRSYKVLASQRLTPGGITAGVRLSDERGLYAIAESVQDMPILQPAEREGIKVEQLPAQDRTLVYCVS